jgi:hypothetical protein
MMPRMIRINHGRHIAYLRIPYPQEIFQFCNAECEVKSMLNFLSDRSLIIRYALCLN